MKYFFFIILSLFHFCLKAQECINPYLKENQKKANEIEKIIQSGYQKSKNFYGEGKIMDKEGRIVIDIECTSKNIKRKKCHAFKVSLIQNKQITYELHIHKDLLQERWKRVWKNKRNKHFKLSKMYNDALEDSIPGKGALFISPGALLSAGIYAIDLFILEPINLIKRLFASKEKRTKRKEARIKKRMFKHFLKKGGLIITRQEEVREIAKRLGLKLRKYPTHFSTLK